MARRPIIRNKVYDFICIYKKENDGLAPTYQTISDHFGWHNPMNAWYHVAGLQRDGLIRLDEDGNIMLVGGQWILKGEDPAKGTKTAPADSSVLISLRLKYKSEKAVRNGYGRTPLDVEEMYNSQKGLCWWCGKPLPEDFHIDHRVPLARGGTNDPGNLCCACPECNIAKHDKMPWEFCGRLL